MNTKSLTGVRYSGIDKLSLNQFEGQPTGVGVAVARELSTMFVDYRSGITLLRRWARNLRMVKASDKPTPSERVQYKAALDSSVSTGTDWYSQLRRDQGTIVQRLIRGVATDDADFANNGLCCEWAYIVNLDYETFEVYRGNSLTRGFGRYALAATAPTNGFWPINLIATWRLPEHADFVPRLKVLYEEQSSV